MGIINVNFNALKDIGRNLSTLAESLASLHSTCETAAEKAISSTSGDVKTAISEAIHQDTKSELDAALKEIGDIAEIISKIGTTYEESNASLLDKIISIRKRAEGESGDTGAQG